MHLGQSDFTRNSSNLGNLRFATRPERIAQISVGGPSIAVQKAPSHPGAHNAGCEDSHLETEQSGDWAISRLGNLKTTQCITQPELSCCAVHIQFRLIISISEVEVSNGSG